jgi:hypothetical protein
MSQTPNHGYNVPNEGEKDWHKPLNANFRQYDTDIEIRDTASNRGNYTPKQGAKFFATDTGTVYLGNGSSWQPVATTGTDPTFGDVQADRIGVGRSPISNSGLTARLDSGQGAAVDAVTASGDNTATAVHAEAESTSGNTFGVYATSRSPDGHGLFGVNFAESGNAIGVEGRNFSPDGVGVQALNRNGLALQAIGASLVKGELEVTEGIGIGRSAIDQHGLTARLDSGQGAAVDAVTASGDNTATAVHAEAESTSGNTFGVYATSRSPDGHGLFGVNFAESGNAIGVEGRNFSPDGVGVQALNREGTALRSVGDCEVTGDLTVDGNKNFSQTVDTDDGEREVVYTATEAPRPRTEASGVVELEDGRAEVDLPDHFGWVTDEDEPVMVQITPHASEPVRPQVTERSIDHIVVEDFADADDYEVCYTVTGTREGHADKRVVREPSAEEPADGSAPAPADD